MNSWDGIVRKCVKKNAFEKFNREREHLIFTHIPKTAGTSLHRLLEESLGEYSLIDPSNYDAIDLESLIGAGGHHNFGFNPLCSSTRKSLVHITVIREPMARYLSFYRHLQQHPKHHLPMAHPEILKMGPLECARFLVDIQNPEISNLQCKMLRGDLRAKPTALNAFHNLCEYFSVFSTLENIDLFAFRLAGMLGSDVTSLPKLNVSSKPSSISAREIFELKKLIYDFNNEDVRLYELVFSHDVSAYHAV